MSGGKQNPCGRKKCYLSTGTCGNLNFGSGKLRSNGTWENPCEICRDDFLKKHTTTNTETEEFREWLGEIGVNA